MLSPSPELPVWGWGPGTPANRSKMRLWNSGLLLATALVAAGCATLTVPPIEGVVWQIDNEHTEPRGDWEKLGVRRLLVQWTVVDDLAFTPGTDVPPDSR